MEGLKFLITLFVIYLIFRSIMRKVLSTVNPDGGGVLKGKLGDLIAHMKREMERARLEAEREASRMDDDSWVDLREVEEESFEGSRSFQEGGGEEEAEVSTSSHDRWDEVDESQALWDSPEVGDVSRVARMHGEASDLPQAPCRLRRKRRMRLKEAVIWKEILDRPVGLRS